MKYSDNENLTIEFANFFKNNSKELDSLIGKKIVDKACETKGISGDQLDFYKQGITDFFEYFEGAAQYVDEIIRKKEEDKPE